MPRPPCCRRIEGEPIATVFKPAGIPTRRLPSTVLTIDEFEAVRLADLEGLYQAQAAARMHVSRPTFGRIINAAHRKVAEALVNGHALFIEGGPVSSECAGGSRRSDCGHPWRGPRACPQCLDDAGAQPQPPQRKQG